MQRLNHIILLIFFLAVASPTCAYAQADTPYYIYGVSAPDSITVDSTATNVPEATAETDAEKLTLKKKLKRTGSLVKRFIKSFDDYDTTYISPNYYNYEAMVQNTNFYQIYRIRGKSEDGTSQTLQLKPTPSLRIGPYFGYRWIFLGYTFDIGHPKRAGESTQFNLSLYSSMLGCDLVLIRNKGDFTIGRVKGFDDATTRAVRNLSFDGMEARTTSFNLYYVFNHRHFSYPAAFAQSTVQRKSCGSWMLGFNFVRQKIEFDYTRLPDALITPDAETGQMPLIDELKFSRVDYRSYNINFGYAYNWVFARNFLFTVSLTPAISFKHEKGQRITGDQIWQNIRSFNFDFIGRSAIVWNNTRYYAGASLVTHVFDYRHNRYTINNFINYINIYVGLNFYKRRQYRTPKH